MDINILREFVVLAEYLNFTKAAHELRMSQSSLSRHMQDLEKELGVELLRRGDGVALTYQGEILLEEAGRIFVIEDRLKDRFKKARGDIQGQLVVEEYPYSQPITNLLLSATNRLRQVHSGISVKFQPTKAGIDIPQSVQDGYFDLAIEVHCGFKMPEFTSSELLQSFPLYKLRSRFCFYLGKSNPLYHENGGSLSLGALEGMSIVFPLTPEFYNFKKDFATICSEFGFQPNYSLNKPTDIKDLSMMNLSDSILVITEADVAYENSIFLQNSDCGIMKCQEDAYATPSLLCRRENNPALQLLMQEIEKAYKAIDET